MYIPLGVILVIAFLVWAHKYESHRFDNIDGEVKDLFRVIGLTVVCVAGLVAVVVFICGVFYRDWEMMVPSFVILLITGLIMERIEKKEDNN